jgi:hypothetical protein
MNKEPFKRLIITVMNRLRGGLIMALKYRCRHCGIQMGTIDNISVDSESVGLNKLTDEERMEMISYESTGDVHIKSICEDCHESLERNPDYYQHDYLIH